MSGVLTSIATGAPELIYHPIFIAAGTQLVLQARQTPGLENVKQMGGDGMFSPDVMEGGGDIVEGVFVSSPDTSTFGPDYEAKFKPAYMAKFGSEPISIFHAHAYDAMNLVLACVEKVTVKDKDGTLHIPRQGLRDCMYSTKDFKGLTGNLTSSPTGDCADPKIASLPVEDASVDAVTSNCVINLVPDKARVFAEIARVLKPGGRLVISDVVLDGRLPEAVERDVYAYVGCVAGATLREDYFGQLSAAGLGPAEVLSDVDFMAGLVAAAPAEVAALVDRTGVRWEDVEGKVRSITFRARKAS